MQETTRTPAISTALRSGKYLPPSPSEERRFPPGSPSATAIAAATIQAECTPILPAVQLTIGRQLPRRPIRSRSHRGPPAGNTTNRVLVFQSAIKNRQSSILIKSSPALPTQPSRIHHLHQQRTRTVLRISQPILQHAHDVQTNIQPNEIGQR